MDIPADIRTRCYHTIRRIHSDHSRPDPMVRDATVFWGPTGTGKSRKAWELEPDAYPKDPNNKWWDGYTGEKAVIIDEFRGKIDIAHLLRWFDRYKCNVEVKGGCIALRAQTFYITSNLHPKDWYKDIDLETYDALKRRINIEFMG